jgi:hypothetical protein
MKFLVFIFKHRFRRGALNNILKCYKIKNIYIVDLSGPILSIIGKILYFLIRSKKVIFVSCDGLDFLKREKNSINLWMGGTTEKISDRYKKYKNNFVSCSTIFTDDKKLLTFYPTMIKKNKLNKDFKFVYASENKQIKFEKSLSIWKKNKKIILDDLQILNSWNFWKKNLDLKIDQFQNIYIDIKSLLRSELVNELINILKSRLILVGTDWKKIYPEAIESNYSSKFIRSIYKGNICVDFGSKNSAKCIYPRSVEIIESGGLLFQSMHQDSKKIFKNLVEKTCFNSVNDMRVKIKYFSNNPHAIEDIFIKQQLNFDNDNLNYDTLKKIESSIKN